MPASAILVAVQPPEVSSDEVERSLAELTNLVTGLGMRVVARIVQKRPSRAAPAYLGEGKLRELLELAKATPDCVVVADDELSPGQLRNLGKALEDAEVIDRTDVILRVFESRARTAEARLEVELARLEYELPRVRDVHSLGDREGGGGRAGRGHTNVELRKQRTRARIATVRRELEKRDADAARRRSARAETFRVALVGYTNAGKSSIMRLLTGSEVLVDDRLFATLGTTVRELSPPATPPVVVADTVGFIHRLPHALVASFRSTLAEAREAWLLVHVVDASDPAFRSHVRVSLATLAEVGAGDTPVITVLNKIDRVAPDVRDALAEELPDAVQTCALDPGSGAALRERIVAFFDAHLEEERLSLTYAQHGVLAALRDHIRVVAEDWGDTITLTVRGTPEALGRLRQRLAETR